MFGKVSPRPIPITVCLATLFSAEEIEFAHSAREPSWVGTGFLGVYQSGNQYLISGRQVRFSSIAPPQLKKGDSNDLKSGRVICECA